MGRKLLLVYEEKHLSESAGGIKAVKKAFKRVKDLSVKICSDEKIKEKKEKFWKAVIFMKGDDVEGTVKDIKDNMDGKKSSKVLVITETTEDAVIESADMVPGTDYILKRKSLEDISTWWPRMLNFLFGVSGDPLVKPLEQKKRCMFLFNGNANQHDESELEWYKKINVVLQEFGVKCVWQGDSDFEAVRTTNPQSVYQLILARNDGQGMTNENCRILTKNGKMVVFTDNKRSEICKYLKSLEGSKGVNMFTIKDKTVLGYINWVHMLSGLDLIKVQLSTAVSRETYIIVALILFALLIVFPFFIGMVIVQACFGIEVFKCLEPCLKSEAMSVLTELWCATVCFSGNVVVPEVLAEAIAEEVADKVAEKAVDGVVDRRTQQPNQAGGPLIGMLRCTGPDVVVQ